MHLDQINIIACHRDPKGLNFPDGKIQGPKTFQTNCVNRFCDKKVRKWFFVTNKVRKSFGDKKVHEIAI